MTTIYYVCYAQPSHQNHNNAERELTKECLRDRSLACAYLKDILIDVGVYSSLHLAAW